MTRPNVLFLMPDQLRADFIGCYGAGFAKTPHIDALAARGTRFERCLSPTPICVPARASLLTGGSSMETGVMSNGTWLRPDLDACGLTPWPRTLSRAGYATYGIGKMHFCPWDDDMGFTKRVIAEDKRHIGVRDDYAAYLAKLGQHKLHGRDMDGYAENGGACLSPLPAEQQVDAWCADRAIDVLRDHDPGQPFAMMVGFPSPHCPYDPPADIAAMFAPEDMPAPAPETAESRALKPWLVQNMKLPWADLDYSDFTPAQIAQVRAHYSALIHLVDRAVGRILETLEETGLAENTIVIFASDHGDFVGDYGLICKNFFMDGSVRVPMIVSGPGTVPGLRHDTVCLTDVYATLMQAAGLELREGADVTSLLAAPPDAPRVIAGLTHRGMMIERGRMKLARYVEGVATLHDMAADPGEQVNLIDDPAHADTRRDLEARLSQWLVREALKGHAEKAVDFSAGKAEGAGFFERGWQRPYPIGEGAVHDA